MLSRSFCVCVVFILCVYVLGHIFWGGSPHARRSYYYVAPEPLGRVELLVEDIEVVDIEVDMGVVVEELNAITRQLDDLAIDVVDVHIDEVLLGD